MPKVVKNKTKVSESEGRKEKRHRQIKWTQEETELLCDLLLMYGSAGIMAKTSNASTNEKKKKEWETIVIQYNSNASVCLCVNFFFVFHLHISLSHFLYPDTLHS